MLYNSHSVRVEKLSISFTALSELKLEPAFSVKYLYSMIVCISNNNIILSIDSYTTGLCELSCNRKNRSVIGSIEVYKYQRQVSDRYRSIAIKTVGPSSSSVVEAFCMADQVILMCMSNHMRQ